MENFKEIELDDLIVEVNNVVGNLEGFRDKYNLYSELNADYKSSHERISDIVCLLESLVDEIEDVEEVLVGLLEHAYSLKIR